MSYLQKEVELIDPDVDILPIPGEDEYIEWFKREYIEENYDDA